MERVEDLLQALLEDRLADAPVEEPERKLLELVRTVTLHAYRVTDTQVEELRRLGWSDEQVAEAVYVAALFAFFNRVADAFGIDSQGYGGPRIPPPLD